MLVTRYAALVALLVFAACAPRPDRMSGMTQLVAAAADRCALEKRWKCAAEGYAILAKSAPTATERRVYRIKAVHAHRLANTEEK